MEDISRELEREIARAKPKPHKTSRKKKILVVDDFGEMRPGGHLKVMLYLLLVTSLIGLLCAGVLYVLFDMANRENVTLKSDLAVLEKQVGRLTNDKELLMARLVMSGEKPELPEVAAAVPPVVKKQETKVQSARSKVKKNGILPKPEVMPKAKSERRPGEDDPDTIVPEVSAVQKTEPSGSAPTVPEAVSEKGPGDSVDEPFVSVEQFSLSKGSGSGDLVVRFDIRNISTQPGGISGRIFTVLKPKDALASEWVVVPNSPLENGVPAVYKKGQYFSISRFKPVKFTIRNQSAPDAFNAAAVYVFNDDGKLVFESSVEINEAVVN